MSKPAAIVEIEREINERRAAEKAKRDAEIERIAAENAKRAAVEEGERKRQIEAEDKRREEQFERTLEAEARSLFFSGNGGASEEVYKSVREEYRRLVMRRRAEAAERETHSMYKGWQPLG